MSNDAGSSLFSLTAQCVWEGALSEAILRDLPSRPAVFQFENAAGAPLLFATTQNLRAATAARLGPGTAPAPGRADLRDVVRGVRWIEVSGPFEARWKHYRILRERDPTNYRKLIGFGPAWFLNVNFVARVPDLRVTERIYTLSGEFAGPWPTQRDATAVLEELWDLFELCRYPAEVARAPGGKRCAYADMGRCDAPCDGGAPLDRYAERVRAAWSFVCGGAEHWLAESAARMQRAAAALDFEGAQLIKRQREWAEGWRSAGQARVRRAEEMNFLIACGVARRREARLVLFRWGAMEEGPTLKLLSLEKEAAAWTAARLVESPPPTPPEIRMEQTWLLAQLLERAASESTLVVPLTEGGVDESVRRALREFAQSQREPGGAGAASA